MPSVDGNGSSVVGDGTFYAVWNDFSYSYSSNATSPLLPTGDLINNEAHAKGTYSIEGTTPTEVSFNTLNGSITWSTKPASGTTIRVKHTKSTKIAEYIWF